jgi:hypothetical protein
MAMVALGGTDANFEFGVHAWDMAAGYLIVTEAGGVVIDPAGTKLCVCVCVCVCIPPLLRNSNHINLESRTDFLDVSTHSIHSISYMILIC